MEQNENMRRNETLRKLRTWIKHYRDYSLYYSETERIITIKW